MLLDILQLTFVVNTNKLRVFR